MTNPADLPPALSRVAARFTRTLRRMGCTCPTPDVRWDPGDGSPGDGMPVALHYPPCPLPPMPYLPHDIAAPDPLGTDWRES